MFKIGYTDEALAKDCIEVKAQMIADREFDLRDAGIWPNAIESHKVTEDKDSVLIQWALISDHFAEKYLGLGGKIKSPWWYVW